MNWYRPYKSEPTIKADPRLLRTKKVELRKGSGARPISSEQFKMWRCFPLRQAEGDTRAISSRPHPGLLLPFHTLTRSAITLSHPNGRGTARTRVIGDHRGGLGRTIHIGEKFVQVHGAQARFFSI